MQIFVAKNGQQLGPFDEAQVRGMLAGGSVAGEDLAWHAALPGWEPLSAVLGALSGGGGAPSVGAVPVAPVATASSVSSPVTATPMGGGTVLPPPGGAGYGLSPVVGAAGVPGELAGRGNRLGAVLIDSLIGFLCALPGGILIAIGGVNEEGKPGALAVIGYILIFVAVLAFVAYQIFLITKTGQTVGKKLCGVRIVRTNGQLPGFVHGFLLRSIVAALPSGIPVLGSVYGIVDACFIFRDDRRCIHDLIADTRVVRA